MSRNRVRAADKHSGSCRPMSTTCGVEGALSQEEVGPPSKVKLARARKRGEARYVEDGPGQRTRTGYPWGRVVWLLGWQCRADPAFPGLGTRGATWPGVQTRTELDAGIPAGGLAGLFDGLTPASTEHVGVFAGWCLSLDVSAQHGFPSRDAIRVRSSCFLLDHTELTRRVTWAARVSHPPVTLAGTMLELRHPASL